MMTQPPANDFQYPEDESETQEPIAPAPDLDDDLRESRRAIVAWFENVFHILNAYQSHQRGDRELRMSLRAMEIALGFHLAAGASGAADLARKLGMDKQTVNKCVNHFIAQLQLEPLPFQRKAEARANMSAARKAQITKP